MSNGHSPASAAGIRGRGKEMSDQSAKYFAQAIAAVGLAVVGAYLLTHGHSTAGAWLIVAAILTVAS